MNPFGNGLEKDIIIKVLPRTVTGFGMFGETTQEYDYDRILVWADKGFATHFSKIPGVIEARTTETNNRYLICVDPRYNLQWVIGELEATVKLKKPFTKKEKAGDS